MAYANNVDDNITKTIRVEEVASKNGRYTIKSTGGITFSFFERTKNGTPTAAFKQFKELHLQQGSIVELWYREIESENRETGKPITFRNVLTFKEPMDDPEEDGNEGSNAPRVAPLPHKAAAPRPVPKEVLVGEAAKEAEIIGKTASLFMSAAISAGLDLDKAQGEVDKAVMLAERLVNAAKGPRRLKVVHQPERASAVDLAGPWDDEAENALVEARRIDNEEPF